MGSTQEVLPFPRMGTTSFTLLRGLRKGQLLGEVVLSTPLTSLHHFP